MLLIPVEACIHDSCREHQAAVLRRASLELERALQAGAQRAHRVGWQRSETERKGESFCRRLEVQEEVVPPTVVVRGAAEPSSARRGRIDVNRASLRQLQRLPRVGPSLAQRIVDHRPYRSVDELDRVHGIGAVTLERLRPLVTTGPEGESSTSTDP